MRVAPRDSMPQMKTKTQTAHGASTHRATRARTSSFDARYAHVPIAAQAKLSGHATAACVESDSFIGVTARIKPMNISIAPRNSLR
jgi:hypothetical protein